ncbi:MAG: hypothetical protein J6W17_01055 [Campylobacter sp.]|nr:hypothetical protein [Campylobacter sp.]
MVNYTLIFVVVAFVGFIVYMEVQKMAAKAEIYELTPTNDKYIKFCDIIDFEISALKFYDLKNAEQKDEFLSELANLSKELVFIQNMHSTNKNAKIWEEKLFNFLSKVDEVIENYLQNSEEVSNGLKEKLMREFKKL